MKYTIPYDDKITLPHIKRVETISINTDRLSYDNKELSGEVIISGDYSQDNSNDVMEFTHDIPVSFLIDDASISPQINISNFKYELIPSRGIEVMFELDIILIEEKVTRNKEKKLEEVDVVVEETEVNDEDQDIKEFQNKIDENLESALKKNTQKKETKTDSIKREESEDKKEDITEIHEEEDENAKNKKRLNLFKKEKKEIKEEKKETAKKQAKEEQEKTPKEIKEEKEETAKKQAVEEGQKVTPKSIEEEKEETPMTQVLEEVMGIELPEDEFKTNMTSSMSKFNPGFIPRENDKFTTYKILLVEENDNIDEMLEQRNLSKALICHEYNFDQKIVLKIENE